PDNPLGRHVLKLDMPGYLLHGTNQPYGVGMRVSHGCVRLYPENIELLYSLVGIGEQVRIINEPYLAGWQDGQLFFESHRPLEDDTVTPEEHLQDIFDAVRRQTGAFADQREQDEARAVASQALGVPTLVLQGDAQEIYARARIIKNTVTIDPDAPTLAEVRALLDEADDELDEPAEISND
ncbi:MAG: L,D-transpeptidase family protein, partial [Woeseiaceae bacterium]